MSKAYYLAKRNFTYRTQPIVSGGICNVVYLIGISPIPAQVIVGNAVTVAGSITVAATATTSATTATTPTARVVRRLIIADTAASYRTGGSRTDLGDKSNGTVKNAGESSCETGA